MKYQKVLIFVAGSLLFICDIMITVSNIKKLPPILTSDLKFLFKIQIELFIRKTSPRDFVFIFFFSNFGKEKRREKQTVNMPRQYFDIREDKQLSIKIRNYPCLFDISNAGYKEKDRVKNAWKEISH